MSLPSHGSFPVCFQKCRRLRPLRTPGAPPSGGTALARVSRPGAYLALRCPLDCSMNREVPVSPEAKSAAPSGPAAPSGVSDSRRRRSQLVVIIGLFITFGGLLGCALQVPTQPASLESIVPWLAIGFLTAWVGGILAGNSMVEPPPGVRPAMVGQSVVAAFATIAGALSATVVVVRVGPWVAPAAGAPAELEIAIAAAAFSWVGGLLMGRSMRRFARRGRRPTST